MTDGENAVKRSKTERKTAMDRFETYGKTIVEMLDRKNVAVRSGTIEKTEAEMSENDVKAAVGTEGKATAERSETDWKNAER